MEPDEASQAGPYENGSEDIDRVNANGKEKERDYEQPIASTSGQMRETEELPPPVDGQALAEDLAQELQCGCCAEVASDITHPCRRTTTALVSTNTQPLKPYQRFIRL